MAGSSAAGEKAVGMRLPVTKSPGRTHKFPNAALHPGQSNPGCGYRCVAQPQNGAFLRFSIAADLRGDNYDGRLSGNYDGR